MTVPNGGQYDRSMRLTVFRQTSFNDAIGAGCKAAPITRRTQACASYICKKVDCVRADGASIGRSRFSNYRTLLNRFGRMAALGKGYFPEAFVSKLKRRLGRLFAVIGN